MQLDLRSCNLPFIAEHQPFNERNRKKFSAVCSFAVTFVGYGLLTVDHRWSQGMEGVTDDEDAMEWEEEPQLG